MTTPLMPFYRLRNQGNNSGFGIEILLIGEQDYTLSRFTQMELLQGSMIPLGPDFGVDRPVTRSNGDRLEVPEVSRKVGVVPGHSLGWKLRELFVTEDWGVRLAQVRNSDSMRFAVSASV